MTDGSRRFTDREVALILRRASEIDEREGRYGEGALSQEDLREIASEVGISPGAVDRAVAAMSVRQPPSVLLGAPLVRRTVHDVPGELDRTDIVRLLALIDAHADEAGNVTEALGVVRWTSEDHFTSKQVSVAPAAGTTRIQVVEKARPRIRRIFHLVPAAWGVMLAGAASGAVATSGVSTGMLAGLGLAGGLTLGRVAWTVFSGRSAARVAKLAGTLSGAAVDRPGGAADHVSDRLSRAP